MRRAFALLLGLGACQPADDGVLAIAFSLAPPPRSDARVAPPEAEAGVSAGALGLARGRCDVDVPAGLVTCTAEGLPPLASNQQPLAYELGFLIWYDRLPARFDARTIDRDPGVRDPDGPAPQLTPPLPRAPAGPFLPDAFGAAMRVLSRPDFPLDRVAGAEVHLVTRKPGGEAGRYLVLDGRVGELDEAGAPAPAPAPAPGGHHH